MTDLQTVFYIIGIVFMSLMLLIMIVIGIAVLVIRAKIAAIHKQVEERLAVVSEWTDKGEAVLGAIKKVARKSKR
jgi:Na+-transporting methylmalonyl-CoA/oxaloacetate decarboxylase gamma subunit